MARARFSEVCEVLLLAGIYPGVSNVMAAHMISIARREYSADWTFASSSNGASSRSNGAQTQALPSSSASSAGSSAASGAEEAEPLRSGVATMEPNEGRVLR